MCLVGILVAAILFVVLMRKPPDETAANNYVDYGLDTNAGAGDDSAHGRGTRNRDGAAFNNPLYNDVGINVASAPVAAYTAHAPSSSPGAAFVVGDRVEIVDKGVGTVRFVGLHHVEGTYGNSSTLLYGTTCAPFFIPRATRTVLHRVYWAMSLKVYRVLRCATNFQRTMLDRGTFWAFWGSQAPRGSVSNLTPPTARTAVTPVTRNRNRKTFRSRATGTNVLILGFCFSSAVCMRAAADGLAPCLVTRFLGC